jgi:hypothetical protein
MQKCKMFDSSRKNARKMQKCKMLDLSDCPGNDHVLPSRCVRGKSDIFHFQIRCKDSIKTYFSVPSEVKNFSKKSNFRRFLASR